MRCINPYGKFTISSTKTHIILQSNKNDIYQIANNDITHMIHFMNHRKNMLYIIYVIKTSIYDLDNIKNKKKWKYYMS